LQILGTEVLWPAELYIVWEGRKTRNNLDVVTYIRTGHPLDI
jgi:hypothetical protein